VNDIMSALAALRIQRAEIAAMKARVDDTIEIILSLMIPKKSCQRTGSMSGLEKKRAIERAALKAIDENGGWAKTRAVLAAMDFDTGEYGRSKPEAFISSSLSRNPMFACSRSQGWCRADPLERRPH